MIDKSRATEIAQRHLDSLASGYNTFEEAGGLTLLPEETVEKEYGWVFFYSTRRYVETGDELYSLAGNAPFLVTKNSGELHVFGTARPLEDYLEEYERQQDQ